MVPRAFAGGRDCACSADAVIFSPMGIALSAGENRAQYAPKISTPISKAIRMVVDQSVAVPLRERAASLARCFSSQS